ncbi:exopolygalacturonase [Morus notabilis]|nr:exopolygalacturonase [Morus notabilis]
MVCSIAESRAKPKVFNVMDYGAIANGKTDNSKAFLRAWREACEWEGKARVLIPQGTYMLYPVEFIGPCEGHMAFVIRGTLKAPSEAAQAGFYSAEKWINFRNVKGLGVGGGGTVDGQGAASWPLNDCGTNANCQTLPTTMRFDFVSNARIHHLKSIDSKSTHFTIFGCENLNITKVQISAPSDSPNTDGIKIGTSRHVGISRATIGTGDDCVSVLPGSSDIRISEVVCGPGHGISVGSLGKYVDEKDVRGVIVRNSSLRETSNGVRIKTWATDYASTASGFLFEDIVMDNVLNPITIDQNYCPHGACNQKASSHVQISNVVYKNIWGTSSSEVAVTLQCSESAPCNNIVLGNINLSYHGSGRAPSSHCSHVNGFSFGKQSPPSCL